VEPPAGWDVTHMLLGTCVVLGLPGLVLICLVPRRGAVRRSFSLTAFWAIARQKPVVLVGVLQFLASLSYGILLGVFSELARATTGGQVPAIAYYAARVPLVLPAAALGDRIGRGRVLKLSFLLAAAGILVGALWRSSPGISLAICAAAMAAQNLLVASNTMALMGDVARSDERHLALGAAFLWRDLGVAIPLFVAGALKGFLPDAGDAAAVAAVFRWALFGFAGVFVASALLCDVLRRAVERHQAESSG
jgi:MFS family permease